MPSSTPGPDSAQLALAESVEIEINPDTLGLIPRRRGRPPKITRIDTTRMIGPDGTPIDFVVKRRDFFKTIPGDEAGDEWMIIFMAFIRRLLELRITGDTRLVIDWICLKVKQGQGNKVSDVLQSDIAKSCGMHRSNVCTALGRLESLEIVLRGRRGTIYLNPRFMFHGTAAAQRKSIEDWDRMQAERQVK